MIDNLSELVQKDRVRGDVYRDPEIFREEMDVIYSKGWVFLGHESEIPEKGSYVRRQIGTQPVILVRGSDNVFRVFYNRCRHRAALLCHRDRGKTSRFVCPYHAWTYANTGPLLAPSFKEGLGPDFNKEDFPLAPVARVDHYRGLIFASLAEEGISLSEHLGGITEYIDQVYDLSPEGEIMTNAGSQKIQYAGNWKYLPENTMEGDHHGGVIHKVAFAMFTKRTGFKVGQPPEGELEVIKSLPGGHMVEDYRSVVLPPPPPDFKPSEERQQHWGMLVQAHGPDKARALLTTLPPLFFVFPNLLFVMNHFRRIEPVTVDQTNVDYVPVLLKGAPDKINEARLREEEITAGPAGFVAGDDMEILERSHYAIKATGDDWVYLGRGLHREKSYQDGGTGGQSMDENHFRAFWRHYVKVMGAA